MLVFHVSVLICIYFCNQFVAPDIRHCSVCQWWGQDFDKRVCIWSGTQQRGWQTNFLRKAGQSVVLIGCLESCGTQPQLTGGQAAADRAVPALKKTLRQLMIFSHESRGQAADLQDCPWDITGIHGRWLFLGCLCPGSFELTDANCASCMKRATLLLQEFPQSATDFVFFTDERCSRSLRPTIGRTTASTHLVTQRSAALPLSTCCTVVQQMADFIKENSHAFVRLNISNILLVHKYTQHTQLHA